MVQPTQGICVKIIGVGGAGCNIVNQLSKYDFSSDINIVAVHTDSIHLESLSVTNKILIGPNITKGFGTGASPELGKRAANDSLQTLKRVAYSSDLIIICAGLGGGTGGGASPVIAKICSQLAIPVGALVTFPFTAEGTHRKMKAMNCLYELEKHVAVLSCKECDEFVLVANKLFLDCVRAVDGYQARLFQMINLFMKKSGVISMHDVRKIFP